MTAARFAAAGAGRMGRGIAIAFAWAGHRIALVDLRERSPQAAAQLRDEAFGEIRTSLRGLAALGALRDDQVETVVSRIDWVDGAGAADALSGADLLFEGVPETL